MRFLSRAVFVLFLVLGALFAISNPQQVELSMWPLSERWEAPLFLVVAVLLLSGVLIGLLIGWFGGRHHRKLARGRGEEMDRMGREIAQLKADIAGRERAAAADIAALPGAEARSLRRQAALVDPDDVAGLRRTG